MNTFKYSHTETEYLKSRDKKLGTAIDKIGMIKREITLLHLFASLCAYFDPEVV